MIGTGGKNIREVERLTNTIISVDRGSGLLGGGNRRVLVLSSEELQESLAQHSGRRVDEHTEEWSCGPSLLPSKAS